jgi:hypothetical protein
LHAPPPRWQNESLAPRFARLAPDRSRQRAFPGYSSQIFFRRVMAAAKRTAAAIMPLMGMHKERPR